MAARTDTLDPAFRFKLEGLMVECKRLCLPVVLAETERDYAKQNEVFKKGFSKCDGIVKLSMHQARLAADIVALDENGNRSWDYAKYANVYREVAKIARDFGLECGQDWPPFDKATGFGWDVPHYQFRG
jgi:hypothetical protein